MISNPILRGFNPDPSIIRVGDDYYIATSTFEWFPGVQIHHSKDLTNWQLLSRPLNRKSQLDMRGVPDSCGVWAPCLTHCDGIFYLIYTVVRRYGRTTVNGAEGTSLRDFHNYLVTATQIDGEWSEPVYLNSSGFDPSLFHDDDGKKYLLNLVWDHRPGRNHFAGIAIQDYNHASQKLEGEPVIIFEGTEFGFTEGPHIYKHKDWYYLIVAEGGTGYNHGVTLARSRTLKGRYEACPQGTILTSRDKPDLALQRVGHGDLVSTPDGSWLMTYLCARPLPGTDRCILGRETAIQPVYWTEDGWLAEAVPVVNAPNPVSDNSPDVQPLKVRYEFDSPDLPIDFQWLRSPEPDRLFSLSEKPGCLTLWGRETIGSVFEQSLVARRQTSFCFEATTLMDYTPRQFQQSAGLICYYNSTKYHYCYVTCDAELGRHLRVMSAMPELDGAHLYSGTYPVPEGRLEIKVEVAFSKLVFAFRPENAPDWTYLTEVFDASILSDEATIVGQPSFTGSCVGVACQDMSGVGTAAHFDYFEYEEREYQDKP